MPFVPSNSLCELYLKKSQRLLELLMTVTGRRSIHRICWVRTSGSSWIGPQVDWFLEVRMLHRGSCLSSLCTPWVINALWFKVTVLGLLH